MKLYTIYTDNHIGVPPQTCPELANITLEQIEKENAYSTGDNFELKNCEKKDLAALERAYAKHKLMFHDRFVSGNHDVQGYSNDYTLIKDGILFAHYDIILWGNSKAFKFRTKGKGGGFSWINKMAMNNHASISKSEAKELAAYATKYNCKVIIGGHVHPKQVFDQVVNGVRVICCPRGRTSLFI